MTKKKIEGLYAVTPDEQSTDLLLEKVREAIGGGAHVVQYRNKSAERIEQVRQANTVANLARAHNVAFMVNDSVELALATNADGVHLGKNDGDVASARRALGNKLIGVSCYNDLNLAIAAEKSGADYVAFGTAFPSTTKPGAVHAPLELYRQAVRRLSIPVVAIGGITVENAKVLIELGVDAIAVISGLFDADNIRDNAKTFSRMFEKIKQ